MKKMCKNTQETEQRNLCKQSLILCDREVDLGLVDLLLPDQPLGFPSKFMYRSPGGTALFSIFIQCIWGKEIELKLTLIGSPYNDLINLQILLTTTQLAI